MKNTVLLKLSGEALAKTNGIGIDMKKVNEIATEVKSLLDTGVSIGIVIGAGNIWRGRDALENGMDRVSADQMGMLGTILNALAFASALKQLQIGTHVMSAIPMGNMVEPMQVEHARHALEKGEIVLFAGGTGNPYFSTDTTAALRAAEIQASTILMAKNGTDGVYDADPRKNPNAHRFETIRYQEVLSKHLGVMDLTAVTLCEDLGIKTIVFDMGVKGNIKKVMQHPEIGTVVTK
ncbi:MAG: UMP kinase [Prevotella sp.]|nr:UMP kinase [Staphylococcus sp.]MCM1350000.1 UMP kinase [Prevotella sp.]